MWSITAAKLTASDQESCHCQLLPVSPLSPPFLHLPLFSGHLHVCEYVCRSFCLSSQEATSLPPAIPHVSADKTWGIIKHVGHILAEITHTAAPPLIFHRKEERDAYIILTEPEWRETSLCYLHTHMHCQRFIVQGFNGALTPLSLSLYPSLLTHRHTSIHHSASASCFPPLSFLYLPSISFYFHFFPPLHIFLLLFLLLVSYKAMFLPSLS